MVDVGTSLMNAGVDIIVVDSITSLLPAMYFESHIDSIDFENLLDDAKKFDPNNRTDYDITVSFLMLIVCLMEPVIKPVKREPLVKSYIPSFN